MLLEEPKIDVSFREFVNHQLLDGKPQVFIGRYSSRFLFATISKDFYWLVFLKVYIGQCFSRFILTTVSQSFC